MKEDIIAAPAVRLAIVAVAALITGPSLLEAFGVEVASSPTPRSAEGLRRQAEESFKAKRFGEAAASARRLLAHAPLDRSGLRLLSMAEAAQGNPELAGEVAIDASFVSWRDPYTQLRLYELAARSGDVGEAARRADALSRIAEFRKDGFQSLDALLSMPGGPAAVAGRLAARPTWREGYLQELASGRKSDWAVPLLEAVRRTSAPPTGAETDRALSALAGGGRGRAAWAYWQRTGARRATAIGDPDFRSVQVAQPHQPASPFAWSMRADTAVRLVDHRDDAGRPALRVDPGEDRSALFVSRKLPVEPGRYRLTYQASAPAEQLDRLHPDLRCSGPTPAKVTPLGAAAPTGAAKSFAVDLPADCNLLQLGFTAEPGALGDDVVIRQVIFVGAGGGPR